MSKKHFVALAAEIKNLVDAGCRKEAEAAALVVAIVAQNDSPRFDRVRFFAACGL